MPEIKLRPTQFWTESQSFFCHTVVVATVTALYTAVTQVWRSGPFACNSQKASLYTGCAVGLLWTHLRLGLETASTDAVRDVWSGVVMEINIKEKRTFSLDTLEKTVDSKLKASIISKYLFKPHLTCRVLGSTDGCESTAHPLWQCFSTTVCNFNFIGLKNNNIPSWSDCALKWF